jgi:hypothetical protein
MANLFGRPLLETRTGGKAGGGASLTPTGIRVIEAYMRASWPAALPPGHGTNPARLLHPNRAAAALPWIQTVWPPDQRAAPRTTSVKAFANCHRSSERWRDL